MAGKMLSKKHLAGTKLFMGVWAKRLKTEGQEVLVHMTEGLEKSRAQT